jgi:hypothetical protein
MAPKLRPKTAPLEEAIYALTFYISGDKGPNRVLVSRTDSVAELIEKIDETEGLSRFGRSVQDVGFFWKVCQKVPCVSDVMAEPLVSQVGNVLKITREDLAGFRPAESDVELLDPSQLISDLWKEEPPAGRVHIFVDVPGRPSPGTSGMFHV